MPMSMPMCGRPLKVLFLLALLVTTTAFAADGLKDLERELGAAVRAGDAGQVADVVLRIGALDNKDAAEFIHEKILRQVDLFRFRMEEYRDWPPKTPPTSAPESERKKAQEELERMTEARRADDAGVNRIFEAARTALGGLTDAKALDYLYRVAGTNSKDVDARVAVLQVLGEKSGPESESVLVGCIGDRSDDVALVAIEALGRWRTVAAVEPLIDHLGKVEKRRGDVWAACLTALNAITGEEFPTAKDWQSFWDIKGKGFDPETDRGDKHSGGTIVDGAPDFFGTEVISKRIVFIIDTSGSMHERDPVTGGEADDKPTGAPGGADGDAKKKGCDQPGCDGVSCRPDLPKTRERLFRVQRELTRLIGALAPDVQFNVIAFSTKAEPWKERQLVQANGANKGSAAKFVEGFRAKGFTSADYALEEAFENGRATAFYFLSDGSPYRGTAPLPLEPIYEMVRVKTKTRAIKIHAISFPGANEGFMQRLAEMTGGKYTTVR